MKQYESVHRQMMNLLTEQGVKILGSCVLIQMKEIVNEKSQNRV